MMSGWKVMEELRFTIPSLPPSMNQIYQIIRMPGLPIKVEMRGDVRAWKTGAKVYVPKMKALEESYLFAIEAKFVYPFHHKNGKLRKVDTQNLLKVLIDAMAEKNGVGDEWFKMGGWESEDSSRERVEVILRQVRRMEVVVDKVNQISLGDLDKPNV